MKPSTDPLCPTCRLRHPSKGIVVRDPFDCINALSEMVVALSALAAAGHRQSLDELMVRSWGKPTPAPTPR
jgi:hypothetical protein